jgi:energy-coupling factor transporter ATP-binding protein EcfA2
MQTWPWHSEKSINVKIVNEIFMIHLKSIKLVNFKGISHLSCNFDDLTVLAGLNNSGKTTILQAAYLLIASLPKILDHAHIDHPTLNVRKISLDSALAPLSLRDNKWLSSVHFPDIEGKIIGDFTNSLQIELGVLRNSTSEFVFTLLLQDTVTPQRNVRELLGEISKLSVAFLTPPGEVPSREDMVNGDQYQQYLRQGKGAQFWRNSIWWGIQIDGVESFMPVQKKISKYFPEIELLLPTLGTTSPPEIMIKYKEKGRGPLDIAQSGAGLRTFVSLMRILEQSTANIILLDEPDAHLHASQQAIILDLMLDAALRLGRQVIIASHSPEIITRVPPETLRWIERESQDAQSGEDIDRLLERLGATPDIYISRSALPKVLVYVEGVKDRPILEALLKWCRSKSAIPLPTTLVIPHRDGRFESPTLQGIARVVKEFSAGTIVVGVRDMDWYYYDLPTENPEILTGDGWSLITLPCKEMENLLCDPDFLFQAYEDKLSKEQIQQIVDEESNTSEIVDEWRYQLRTRIRDHYPNSDDPSTKDRNADEKFNLWACDPSIRHRLVAGKALLSRVRNRTRREHSLNFYPTRAFEKISSLPQPLLEIVKQIFPCGSFGVYS